MNYQYNEIFKMVLRNVFLFRVKGFNSNIEYENSDVKITFFRDEFSLIYVFNGILKSEHDTQSLISELHRYNLIDQEKLVAFRLSV